VASPHAFTLQGNNFYHRSAATNSSSFYLLIALGSKGLGGLVGHWVGVRTFAFTFWGLVFGSIIYSMPFVVQLLRNSFEAMGRRPIVNGQLN